MWCHDTSVTMRAEGRPNMSQQERHESHEVRELGYATQRCAVCGSGQAPWPCAVERERIAKANGTWEAEDWE